MNQNELKEKEFWELMRRCEVLQEELKEIIKQQNEEMKNRNKFEFVKNV